jgi:hypothetical protein
MNKDEEIMEVNAGDNIFISMNVEIPLSGDILIVLMHKSEVNNDRLVARFSLNTAFLVSDKEN